MNKVEEQLQTQLQEEGWEVLHTGWPDFLCVRGNQTIFVEAKSIDLRGVNFWATPVNTS